jgi:cyanobactin cluster PatC/TenC/TruC protein
VGEKEKPAKEPEKKKSLIPNRTMKVEAMMLRPHSTGLVDYALWMGMFHDHPDTTVKGSRRGRIWA